MRRIARIACVATTAVAACTTHAARVASVAAPASAPLDSARFYADAQYGDTILAAFDGTILLYPDRAQIRIDVGSLQNMSVGGTLMGAFGIRESKTDWRLLTSSVPLAADWWQRTPGVVWTPLTLNVPLPPSADTSGGALLIVLDHPRAHIPIEANERLFVPIHLTSR